jgi:hypothetical protein
MFNEKIESTNHKLVTEILIVVSQTIFYVFLFFLIKNGLVDRQKMMHSKESLRDNGPQLFAIYFAIFVFIALLMIPLDSYEFATYVVLLTYSIMMIVIAYEVYKLYRPSVGEIKKNDFVKPKPESSHTSAFKLPKITTNVQKVSTKRIDF